MKHHLPADVCRCHDSVYASKIYSDATPATNVTIRELSP
jgi:hypothetical protein